MGLWCGTGLTQTWRSVGSRRYLIVFTRTDESRFIWKGGKGEKDFALLSAWVLEEFPGSLTLLLLWFGSRGDIDLCDMLSSINIFTSTLGQLRGNATALWGSKKTPHGVSLCCRISRGKFLFKQKYSILVFEFQLYNNQYQSCLVITLHGSQIVLRL